MKIVNGWAFPDADEFMASQMSPDGTYQLTHLLGAVKHCKRKRVAVDGGAHVGTWSKILAQMFGYVVAFEPSPDTHECLAHNLFSCTNVSFRQQALGKEGGRVDLTLEGFEKAIAAKNTGARFTVPGNQAERITLDSLQMPALDFLKLDIEGGEVDALLGATDTLKLCKPVVLFEDKYHWQRYGYSRNEPHGILASLGAKKIERIGMDEVWGWI